MGVFPRICTGYIAPAFLQTEPVVCAKHGAAALLSRLARRKFPVAYVFRPVRVGDTDFHTKGF